MKYGLRAFVAGIGLGTICTIGIDYILNGNKIMHNVGDEIIEESPGQDVYIIEKGIGPFRRQKSYLSAAVKQIDNSDTIKRDDLKMNIIFKEHYYDTIGESFDLGSNILFSDELIKRNTKNYVKF